MEALFYFLLILFFVLFSVFAFYCYKLKCQVRFLQNSLNQVRQDAQAMDLNLEGMKLLIGKYKSSFPPTILDEIEGECFKARKKADAAVSQRELFEAKIIEERWLALKKWLLQNW